VYHLLGPVDPQVGIRPNYAQLYFYDPQMAEDFRLQAAPNASLNRIVLQELTDMLYKYNPFIELFRTAREMLHSSSIVDTAGVCVRLNPQLRLILDDSTDYRRYNLPTADKIAGIIPDGAEGQY